MLCSINEAGTQQDESPDDEQAHNKMDEQVHNEYEVLLLRQAEN
jgi:hypothetical protein